MALRSLVERQVEAAFRQAKDLATEVTLTKHGVAAYDPTTASVTTAEATTLVADGIVGQTRLTRGDTPVLTTTIVFDAGEIGTVDLYDDVTLDGVVWNITDMEFTDYVVTITASRSQ